MSDPTEQPDSSRAPPAPDPPIRRMPPATGAVVADKAATKRPVPAARQRFLPKPLQRVLGFIVLFATVGMLSCQAFLD